MLVAVVMLIGVFSLVGCSSSERDEQLFGRWVFEHGAAIFITFNEDGTGSRNWHGNQTFRWSTSGDRLNINLDESPGRGYIRNERWNFTVDGDTLEFDSRQTNDRWTYVRP